MIRENLTYCRHEVKDREKEGYIVSSGAAVVNALQLSQATNPLPKSRRTLEVRELLFGGLYVYVCMVTHIARIWVNRVRLPVLHEVS